MQIHSTVNESPPVPYEALFKLHKLNWSLLRFPEHSPRKKLWLSTVKAIRIPLLKQIYLW